MGGGEGQNCIHLYVHVMYMLYVGRCVCMCVRLSFRSIVIVIFFEKRKREGGTQAKKINSSSQINPHNTLYMKINR